MTKHNILVLALLSVLGALTAPLSQAQNSPGAPGFLQYSHSPWVDSIMSQLSQEEKIGQLIMVAAYSNKGEAHKEEILKLIREQKIGGLIFFQGGPLRQAELMNAYQQNATVPLLGAMDAEWGLGMRLDSTISYPFQMALGAIQDNKLLYEMGQEVARQIKRSGLHLNFAPVVDVNNNPDNPVINFRSFGENKHNVADKGIAYMQGLQSKNVLATAKHFPGHGDTSKDSHHTLPQINHSRERLDSLELYPFREMLKAGVGGMMVAHLNIPSLDSAGVASTLSEPIVSELLKQQMGFEGLVVTDAMNMAGVTQGNLPGIVDKKAILAGNDLLEFTEDVPKAIAEIQKAIENGSISQEEIDRRVRKILAVKQWVGLDHFRPIEAENLVDELNTSEGILLNRKLVEASLTVLRNQNLIPLQNLDTLRIATVSFGSKKKTVFQEYLELYSGMTHFNVAVDASEEAVETLGDELENYNVIIAGIHDQSRFPRNTLQFSPPVMTLITDLAKKPNSLFTIFKNPYVLDGIEGIEEADGLILTYQDSDITEELAAQLVFGGIHANGKLPVSIGRKFREGEGLEVTGGIRFSYTTPEDAGMDSESLSSGIDSLMKQAMELKAIPGAQILVAKDQKVVFHKAYGFQSYFDTIRVKKDDLYDLASVTKITAALPALMHLYDQGKFKLDGTLADHLPSFKNSNKADIPYKDLLAHQGRLQPWIPFWKNTLKKDGSYKRKTIRSRYSEDYPIPIAGDMYLHREYPDKIMKAIEESPLLPKKEYVYSDFFFILAPRVVESRIQGSFEDYLQQQFYGPLGATSVGFNPPNPVYKIAPTEHDFFFRNAPIHGTVHDEGAIMLGGISGHAGLFANANDLAKILQMYLNMGTYGGKHYLNATTLAGFTATAFPKSDNPRALGFDKPRYNKEGQSRNTAQDASSRSYGHTGFTGTMVWMDPEENLLYVFLSNRVHPTRENHRLYDLDTRTSIHQVIYDAIKEAKRTSAE